MASNNLNKSVKSTPSCKGGYFSDLTASTGKTASYPLPVRIKVTPSNKMGPLSDGKKNTAKLVQPVLIKDLFPTAQRDRNNSTFTSVSTQKKRFPFQRPSQPYLNTQSCGKPKKEADSESSFLQRKSYGGSKVRRQLYQNLDSPPKAILANKENASKVVKCKKKLVAEKEFIAPKSQIQNKNRTSLLLPPNSIRNSFLKSGINSKFPDQTTRHVPAIKGSKSVPALQKSNHNRKDDNMDTYNTHDAGDTSNFSESMRDNSTMTTPTVSKDIILKKNIDDTISYERPSVIMSPKIRSTSKYMSDLQPSNKVTQNGQVQINPCSCKKKIEFNETFGKEANLPKTDSLDPNNLAQFRSFLEESIKACEDQTIKFRALLNFVDGLNKSSNVESSTVSPSKQEESDAGKEKSVKSELNTVSARTVDKDDSGVTDIVDRDLEKQYPSDCGDFLLPKSCNFDLNGESKLESDGNSLIPIKILITDISQETKDVSSDLSSNTIRLSTIGEVSCEVDDSNKEDKTDVEEYENKENLNGTFEIVNPTTPKTPRTLRRKSNLTESCERRRSARLAAKRMSASSLPDSDKQDSFTMLESELNVKHETMLSKSCPASPMKPPVTPGAIKLWDKKVERPLQEYMALKMNGTFLVTPDVKRFQSCVETTDTPHSRKSLSRKIFMELCDLYAESPERE